MMSMVTVALPVTQDKIYFCGLRVRPDDVRAIVERVPYPGRGVVTEVHVQIGHECKEFVVAKTADEVELALYNGRMTK